ncbi:MAG: DUF1669 domain-containing protein [Bernardetiaceae bacterium]|nr:DUF1669 domain-containing protein [Bernardetiaceae bacterium]
MQAIFTNIRHHVMGELERAERSIWVAVAWFTDKRLMGILENKLRSGVEVKLIIVDDEINMGRYGLDYTDFEALGGEYHTVSEELMHHKFCIIDKKTVISGSYNWTKRAANQNRENITISSDAAYVKSFIEEFSKLYKTYTGKTHVHEYGVGQNLYQKALQAEIKLLELEISFLETEKQSLEQRVRVFQVQFQLRLAVYLREILDWQRKIAAKQAQKTEKQNDKVAHQEAEQTYQKFEEEFEKNKKEAEDNPDKFTIHQNPEKEENLKSIFREIVKQCHPDRVEDKHKEAATQIFRAAQEAKENGDIDALKSILEKLNSGTAFGYNLEDINQTEVLEQLKAERLAQKVSLLSLIDRLQQTKAWQVLTAYKDPALYFEEQKEKLSTQIKELKKKFKSL